ncbi:MAG: EAL domain-containing protein [Desulfobacterales bacterium]|nr:EAL domain-containing protein [Desulfobacterales bacterium]
MSEAGHTQDSVHGPDMKSRLALLGQISRQVIHGKTSHEIIPTTLGQLMRFYPACRAGYGVLMPGAPHFCVEYCRGNPGVADLQGRKLNLKRVKSHFAVTENGFSVRVVDDIARAPEREALAPLIQGDNITAYVMVPLHQSHLPLGILFVYTDQVMEWAHEDVAFLRQVGDSLAIALGEREGKRKVAAQEEFLGHIFDGVDMGVFALRHTRSGHWLFETANQRFKEAKSIGRQRVEEVRLETLLGGVPEDELLRFKGQLDVCLRAGETLQFEEQTLVAGKPQHWLTRLTPIAHQGGGTRVIGATTDITEQKMVEAALQQSECRLNEAQRIAGLGDFERDLDGRVVSGSDQFHAMFHGGQKNGQDGLNLVHPKDRKGLKRHWKRALASGSDYETEYRIQDGEGRERVFKEIGEVRLNDKGDPVKISGIIQDISEKKAFRDEIELARKVFDNAVEGVVVTDAEGTIQFVNKGFTLITGYTFEEAVGENPRILKSNRHGQDFYRKMWDDLELLGQWSGEIWNRRKDGQAYPEWLTITAIRDKTGQPVRYISVFNDLSDIREREEKIHFQANYDALTGLPNRTLLKDRLQLALNRASREGKGLSLILLDMDDFKNVNESLGHVQGDVLLQKVARRLQGCVREQDTVARYGGDEFMILIPDTDKAEVIMQIIERILKSLEPSFTIEGREFFMTVSIGITTSPDDGENLDTLIANADMAMYRAKEGGKRRYGFFTPDLNQKVNRRFELEADLRKALNRTEFVLYYQPKIDMFTHRIAGAEALVRWRHQEKGLVPPGDFIPLSEETGLVIPMGEWILHRACETARVWSDHLGYPFRVAVNISPRQVTDSDLVSLVDDLLSENGIEPANLELEITESAVMVDVDRAKDMFHSLHDMGVHISVDDFGTGFSSLSYLRLFPIDSLKIDKSFIDDIPGDPDSNTMVSTIISMAEHLNLKTIAEGVETRDQLDFLKGQKCDQIQGYYFSPPVPEDEFFQALKEDKLP